jgi:hypothetical protein
MAKFVPLTAASDGSTVWINFDMVQCFRGSKIDRYLDVTATAIIFGPSTHGEGNSIEVKETVDEVLAMHFAK